MTTKTCTVRTHNRVISRNPLDTEVHQEMLAAFRIDRALDTDDLVASITRELLPANDGIGGFDPRNLGMI